LQNVKVSQRILREGGILIIMRIQDPISVEAINEQNRLFWIEQSELMERRMRDDVVFQFAYDIVKSEPIRHVPITYQLQIGEALAKGEEFKKLVLSSNGKKGRMTPRSNSLQNLIEEIVRKNPKITVGGLVRELEGASGAGVVTGIDRASSCLAGDSPQIRYFEDNEKEKTASLKGLKDRLSRAKRKIASH
jgi:hypothetical protein